MLEEEEVRDEPRYRQILRPLGVELDKMFARYVTLFETDQAIIWQAYPHGDLTQPKSGIVGLDELIQVVEKREEARAETGSLRAGNVRTGRLFGLGARRATEELVSQKPLTKHPLLPEGYEEFFRALGLRLDKERATQIMVAEASDYVTVEYHMYLPLYVRVDPVLLERATRYKEIEFRRPEVHTLIADALTYRGSRFFR
jgi:hypothetical protein